MPDKTVPNTPIDDRSTRSKAILDWMRQIAANRGYKVQIAPGYADFIADEEREQRLAAKSPLYVPLSSFIPRLTAKFTEEVAYGFKATVFKEKPGTVTLRVIFPDHEVDARLSHERLAKLNASASAAKQPAARGVLSDQAANSGPQRTNKEDTMSKKGTAENKSTPNTGFVWICETQVGDKKVRVLADTITDALKAVAKDYPKDVWTCVNRDNDTSRVDITATRGIGNEPEPAKDQQMTPGEFIADAREKGIIKFDGKRASLPKPPGLKGWWPTDEYDILCAQVLLDGKSSSIHHAASRLTAFYKSTWKTTDEESLKWISWSNDNLLTKHGIQAYFLMDDGGKKSSDSETKQESKSSDKKSAKSSPKKAPAKSVSKAASSKASSVKAKASKRR